MGPMNNQHQAIYIGPEDDLNTICARIQGVATPEIVLVISHQNQLRASGAWHTLYLYARRHNKRIQVISDSAYIRSIAHSVRFKSARTLDELLYEKPVYSRPSPHFSQSRVDRRRADTVEGINFLFANDDVEIGPPRQDFPRADIDETPLSFLFDDEEDLPLRPTTPDKPRPTPIRLSKPPTPVDIRPARRILPQPRLPWDDDDDDSLAPQPAKFVRRRTNPLLRSLQQRSMRKLRSRRQEPLRPMEVLPVVAIGLFIIVRAIVRYMRGKGVTKRA